MFNYFTRFTFDEDTEVFEISFRDFNNAQTVAYADDEIELQAADSLVAAIGDCIDARIAIPEASKAEAGEVLIRLPVLVCLKAALHNAMLQTGTPKADLARKLNQKGAQIDRLLDVGYASKIDTLEQALYLLGYDVMVAIKEI